MENDQSGYMSTLSLRMNAKLGGINHSLEPGPLSWFNDTIVIGMYVSKPGPEARMERCLSLLSLEAAI